MTSFLRLNGINLPVADGSFGVTQEEIGSFHRAEDGTPIYNRRGIRRTWRGTTPPQAPATALAFRDLVSGKGHLVNFEGNNYYSTKGLAPAAVGGTFSIVNTDAKYGTYRGNIGVDVITYPAFTSGFPWSVSFWRAPAALPWEHYVIRSDGAKWLNGVRNDAMVVTGFFSGVAAGVVSIGGTGFNWFDDIAMLPYLVPTDWPAQIYAAGFAFGALPKLAIDGLGVENNGFVLQVKGEAGELRSFQVQVGGVVTPNYQDFSFELLEA